jgi:hypothetical protein
MTTELVVRYALLPLRLLYVCAWVVVATTFAVPMGLVRLCAKLAEPPDLES